MQTETTNTQQSFVSDKNWIK